MDDNKQSVPPVPSAQPINPTGTPNPSPKPVDGTTPAPSIGQ